MNTDKQTPHLNQTGLTVAVANETGLPTYRVAPVIRALLDVVGRAVSEGTEVRLTNFGTFSRGEARAHNPQTMENLGTVKTVRFRSTGRLRTAVRSGTPIGTLKKNLNR